MSWILIHDMHSILIIYWLIVDLQPELQPVPGWPGDLWAGSRHLGGPVGGQSPGCGQAAQHGRRPARALHQVPLHTLLASVEDPEPDPNPHVFGPPVSGSIGQRSRLGSRSGSGSLPFLIKVLSRGTDLDPDLAPDPYLFSYRSWADWNNACNGDGPQWMFMNDVWMYPLYKRK